MSNGVTNWPLRTTHPDAPTSGRVLTYIYDDGAGSIEPYYMREDGTPRTLIGSQGAQGEQGEQGLQGIQGVQGPVGPVQLIAIDTLATTVTLPDTAGYTQVRNFNFNVPSNGQYVMQAVTAIRPHSTGNDIRFEWDLNGNTVSPKDYYSEEHKDVSAAQSNLRPHQLDLGNLSTGSNQLELYFRKEGTGGTAQLKYLSIFIWKVS